VVYDNNQSRLTVILFPRFKHPASHQTCGLVAVVKYNELRSYMGSRGLAVVRLVENGVKVKTEGVGHNGNAMRVALLLKYGEATDEPRSNLIILPMLGSQGHEAVVPLRRGGKPCTVFITENLLLEDEVGMTEED
jgi:hypothetical protein